MDNQQEKLRSVIDKVLIDTKNCDMSVEVLSDYLVDRIVDKFKGTVVIPPKITEETSAETILKIAKYNEKIRKETAREIFNGIFALINNAKDKLSKIFGEGSDYGKGYKNSVNHFNEHILELAKQYGVEVEE